MYISDFLYRWPKVRSILRPPHYVSQWAEFQIILFCFKSMSNSRNIPQWVFTNHSSRHMHHWPLHWAMEVMWRHHRSQTVFLAITFDWDKIQPPKQVQFVCLDETNQLICNMTYSGQVMTLTSGQIFNLTFWGHIIYHSTRLYDRNTMVLEISL